MSDTTRRVELCFADSDVPDDTITNLSALRRDGQYVWTAGDESATIERLAGEFDSSGQPVRFARHQGFNLADYVALPEGGHAEADIEGLARSGAWLWAIGSHSLKRKRIKDKHSPKKARRRLATVVREENRFTLVRLPITTGADGAPEPRVSVEEDGEVRTAAFFGRPGETITDLLADDPHLAAFLALPGKDNGVDIEGIAAHGERIYLGLRGPVLRGWAVLIELLPETDPDDPHRLHLAELAPGQRYLTHFLDLGGLGIRDICPDGDDLLLLVGPSMDLDGPVRVLRWPKAAVREGAEVVGADDLSHVAELSFGVGTDHAEGIVVYPPGAGETAQRLLVVYDSPAPDRLTKTGVQADLVTVGDQPR
ncbi:DUF3616 domain-containing protein [Salinactinospora qingdaonensis]|uniref:DUF3616 domain-containing protein n=1 Tax=Salinactinospora qingdaonensis TaxID=702744 RepID=A0ABP7GI46_9ACTN